MGNKIISEKFLNDFPNRNGIKKGHPQINVNGLLFFLKERQKQKTTSIKKWLPKNPANEKIS